MKRYFAAAALLAGSVEPAEVAGALRLGAHDYAEN